MIDRSCIIIDDEPQDEIIENLKERAHLEGILLSCRQINPLADEFLKTVGTDALPDYVIDIDRVVEKIRNSGYRRTHVFACDYVLQDNDVNGFEIIRRLRGELKYKNAIVLYSAGLETLIQEILTLPSQKDQIKRLRNLTTINLADIADRENYPHAVLHAVQEDEFSLRSELFELLRRHGDLKFQSTFPPFAGMTLFEVLEAMESDTKDAKGFQRAILENTIALLVEINTE